MSVSIGAAPQVANYPFGFQSGVAIQQMPVLNAYSGKVFWVHSVTGDDGGPGTFNKPWKTLANAITKASSGGYNEPMGARGDIIAVKSGHVETISTATYLNMSVAGMQVLGFGAGIFAPTFTLDTANTATITVSAANVSFTNCIFKANFLNIAVLFTLTTAKGFGLYNCLVQDTSSSLNFLNLIATSTTSNAADGLQIIGSQFNLLATSGVVNLLSALGTNDNITISGNIYTAQTTGTGAVIPIATGKSLTNCNVLNNLFNLQNAASTSTGYLITTDSACTGFIHGNIDHCLANTTYASSLQVTAGHGFVFGQNWHSRTADKSPGVVLPAADS